MIVFIVYFIMFITLIFLLAKLHINDEFDWKIDLSIAAIGAIFLGSITISQANYPAEYSQPKTETHNLVEYGTNRYFLMSTAKDTTTVLIEGKDGSYHPESFDNDVVSYKGPETILGLRLHTRPQRNVQCGKKFCLEGKIKRLGKR